MSDTEPPRKRARSYSSDVGEAQPVEPQLPETPGLPPEDASSSVVPGNRDENFYFPDGNCVVLVDSTLFNVHRGILSRDSSTFSTLFALPQGESREGTCDSDPIVLQGETAEEFRNFLWAMYALPLELKRLFDTQSDVAKLLDIAKVSKKYCLGSVEVWACEAIQANISRRALEFDDIDSETREEIANVIRFAASHRLDKLLDAIVSALKERLTLSTSCLIFTMKLCHEFESDEAIQSDFPPVSTLLGEAYYSGMLRGSAFWDAHENQLSDQAKHRMLTGHYHLSQDWARIQSNSEPYFGHTCTWSGKRRKHCHSKWREFWKQTIASSSVLQVELADIRGKLRAISSAVDGWHCGNAVNDACKQSVKDDLQMKILKLEEQFPDYFLKA